MSRLPAVFFTDRNRPRAVPARRERYGIIDRHQTFDSPVIGSTWTEDELKMAVSTVFSCTDLRARVISSLPTVVYRRDDEGRRVRVPDPPRWVDPEQMPNPNETAMGMIHRIVTGLDLDGNAYLQVLDRRRNGILPEVVANIAPHQVSPFKEDGRVKLRVGGRVFERYTPMTRSGEVLWIKRFDRGGLRGLSPIEATPNALNIGVSAQDTVQAYLNTGAGPPPGALRVIGGDDDQVDEFVEELEARSTGPRRQFIMVIPENVEWVEFSHNPIAAQLMECRKLSMQEVCAIYGVPKQLLSMTETTWATGVTSLILYLYAQSLAPTMRLIEEAFTLALPPGMHFRFDAKGLLRMDPKLRADYYSKLLQYGAITRNEVREEEEFDPIDGLDEPLVPISYGLEAQIRAIAEQVMAEARDDEPEPDDTPANLPAADL